MEISINNGQVKAAGFLPGKLEQHHRAHFTEFAPPLSVADYNERAKLFFECPKNNDIEWFIDVDGYLYKFNKATNEFGIC